MDATGPSGEIVTTSWLIYELIKSLAWGIAEGATNLRLAVEDNLQNNEQAARDLANQAEEFFGGSSYTPWDRDRRVERSDEWGLANQTDRLLIFFR